MSNIENRFDNIFNYNGIEIDNDRKREFYEIYDKFKDQTPFDIVRFARELGINLFASRSFKDSQSGKIEYDSIAKNYNIYINANHSINRNIFTLAHEVGHYFCDKDYLEEKNFILEEESKPNFLNRSSTEEDEDLIKREVRANKFAAEILMPTKKFIEVWHNSKSIEDIAKTFRVSTEAVRIRASNVLGVIL